MKKWNVSNCLPTDLGCAEPGAFAELAWTAHCQPEQANPHLTTTQLEA